MVKKGTQLEENRSDSKDNTGLPDEATRISWGLAASIVLFAIVACALICFGALPIYGMLATEMTVWKLILCLSLIVLGGLLLYTILFNLFRIIGRNQRHQYDWFIDKKDRDS